MGNLKKKITDLSDKLKIKFLDIVNSNFRKFKIIKSLSSDKLKIECLDKIDDFYKNRIIKSLSNDELKIECLKKVNVYEYGDIVKSLSDDESKIRYLDKVDDYCIGIIIDSLPNDELKIKCLDKVDGYWKTKIIQSLSSEELKIKLLDKVDGYCKTEIIKKLSSEELKIKCLDSVNDYCKAEIINSLSSEELKIKLLDKVDDCWKTEIIKNLLSDQLKIVCLNKIDSLHKNSILKTLKNKNLVLEYFIDNNYSYSDINNFFLDESIIFEYSETDIILKYIERISKDYRLNYEHVRRLASLAGTRILFNIENEKIKNIINLDDESFNNLLNLFNEDNIRLKSDSVNDIINVVLSKRFKINNSDIFNIFILLKNLIDQNDKEKILEISQKVIGIDLFNENLRKFNFNGTFQDFIFKLVDKGDNDHNKYLEILHNITNEFITLEKNKYINNNRDSLLNKISKRRYDRSSIIKYVIKEYSFEELKKLFERIKKDKLSEELKELINNEEILKKIINFKNNPTTNANDKVLFSYIKSFNSLMNILYEQDLLVPKEEDQDKISKTNDIFASTEDNIYNIIINLNVKSMLNQDGILSNQELYNQLQEKLKKYKVLGYGNYLNEILKIGELGDGIILASTFLNNYALIVENIQKKSRAKENLTMYLYFINALSGMSNEYALLIGGEDYRLIKENSGPNSASMSYEERIKRIPSLIKNMYERNSITVPPIDETVELANGKKLEVILGDVTNSVNLTHGERTGACMRIGGAGATLFEFCLKNEQGFHMRFIDPNTSEYISRVSGFRNGNTVFLNQLRSSLNSSKYSNEDLEDACTKISKMLIELTKNSSYPIENVIISSGYAMASSKKIQTPLPVNDIKEDYESLYSDVSPTNAILLASNNGKELAEIKLGSNNCERYAPLRRKPQLVSSNDALLLKARMEIIDQLLYGIEFENCNYDNIFKNVQEAYFGQDWYFIVLENGEILQYIMKNSKDKSLALHEISETVPKTLLDNNSKFNDELGGIKK